MGLAGKIWPSRYVTGIRAGTDASLTQDAAHPGLIGIRYKRTPQPDEGTTEINESTWWLDPVRDDMPVETTWSSSPRAGAAVRTEMRVRYLDYAQLPDGQWYPTRWQEDRSDRDRKTGKMVPSTQYYRLQIWPKLRLGDEWFRPPEPPPTTQPPPARN